MNKYLYDIQSAWKSPAQSAETVGRRFLGTLDALTQIDPILGDWGTKLDDSNLGQPIDAVRPNITDFVEKNAGLDDDDEPDPIYGGYWLFAANQFGRGPLNRPDRIRFDLCTGSARINHYNLEVGSQSMPPPPSILSYSLFRSALLALIKIWPAPWANMRVSPWGEDPPSLPDGSAFPYSGFQMPWFSYLCAERAAKVTVSPAILTERTPDGGLLMIAAETRLDPDNPQHLIRSKMLAEIMIAHGGDPAW